jgi:D-glycero-D-manno-heptose 1,7-bisphosphate phosphatase
VVEIKNVSRRAAFLDRDGVINKSLIRSGIPVPPRDYGEVTIIEGVTDSLNLFRKNGIIPVVITNQPDVSRGITTMETAESINELIRHLTGIEHFYICFHDNFDNCNCRKPKTGLILNAVRDLKINLGDSFVVGDRWRDIKAGQSLGMRSYFIDYSYGETEPEPPFMRVSSLREVARIELGESHESEN